VATARKSASPSGTDVDTYLAESAGRRRRLNRRSNPSGTEQRPATFPRRPSSDIRPDRIIVGEVRGPEARTLLDAMNTGHRGTLATIHASSAKEALHRLAALAIRGASGLSLTIAENEIARRLDVVAFVQRVDGIRSVREITILSQPGLRPVE
jgi:hypothetical protein